MSLADRLRRTVARDALLCLATIFAGCAADSRPGVVVERADSAGVELVTTRGADARLDWSFEPVLKLGGEEQGPASFFRLVRAYVGADAAGRLYVLDATNHRVVVFDDAGRHLHTLGREGGGPGELQWPFNLSVAPDGAVSVYDAGKRALVRWAPDAAVLEQLQPEIAYFGPMLEESGSRILFTGREYRRDEPTSFDLLLSWSNGEETELVRFEHPTAKMATFPTCGASFPPSPIFAPRLEWDADGVAVAVSAGVDYVLDVFVRDRRVRSMRRDVAPRPATEELALQHIGDGMTFNRTCLIPADEYLRGSGFAPVVPAIDGIALAPSGEVWVRRGHVRGEDPLVDLFGADGAYVGTLPPGSPFPIAFLPGGRIAAVERDDVDVDRLVVYRVERGGVPGVQ